jgi:hypothetical protein
MGCQLALFRTGWSHRLFVFELLRTYFASGVSLKDRFHLNQRRRLRNTIDSLRWRRNRFFF